jgi:hypothetical protein
MTLHARCPTNGTEIDFGFPVYSADASGSTGPAGQPRVGLPRGHALGTRLPTGDIQVDVSECPACGRVHRFVTVETMPT